MPTKTGKVTKRYSSKKRWASSRRVKGWKPARQSKYFTTTLMGTGPILIQTGSLSDNSGASGATLINQRAAYGFTLLGLGNPDVGHYCAVFDEYRVDKVEIYQTPRATEASVINVVEPTGGSNPGYWNAVIHWATECEPQLAVPPNAVAVMQQDSYFNTDQTKAAKFSLKPRTVLLGSNGTTGGIILTAAPATQWISCQDLNAQWNGIQWYADPCTNTDLLPGGTPMTISLWVRLHVSFRNI